MRSAVLALLIAWAGVTQADETVDQCLLEALRNAAPQTTAAELRAACDASQAPAVPADGAVARRLSSESQLAENPWSLQTHRQNYLLPVTFNPSPNTAPFQGPARDGGPQFPEMDETEAKFQLSVKLPVVRNLFGIGTLYAAYTGTSWWQVYNKEISAPFRETNHEPELFLAMPTTWQAAGFRLPVVSVGLAHESNGRAQPLSRSWNRVYAEFVAERGNLAVSFKPWYRLPESKKQDPMQADGDDNPDITDYLGHFELGAAWRIGDDVLRAQWRRNFSSGNGGLELSWSHPLRSNLKLFTQYYEGYGESLIDYNYYTRRVGVGLSFGDVL